MEKWPSGWKFELAINIKNGEQLSKWKPWPKFYSSQLTVDWKNRPSSWKEDFRVPIWILLYTLSQGDGWFYARKRQKLLNLFIRPTVRGEVILQLYRRPSSASPAKHRTKAIGRLYSASYSRLNQTSITVRWAQVWSTCALPSHWVLSVWTLPSEKSRKTSLSWYCHIKRPKCLENCHIYSEFWLLALNLLLIYYTILNSLAKLNFLGKF
jgi:hypothetical protein